jgi:hypothetical protein
MLINGGKCDIGTDDGKVKGKANFSSINGIWLDIDDGELTPHELANVILPQFKLVIFNSFNNGVDGKLKYRVLIPTSRPMPSAAYEMVWDVLKEMIGSFGYFVGFRDAYAKKARFMPNLKWSGVDQSKRAANSFYYYPCRAIKGGQHSFFHRFLDEPRAYLDPLDMLDFVKTFENDYVELPAHRNPVSASLKALREKLTAPATPDETERQAKVAQRKDEAINEWRAISHVDDARNHAFFVLGLRLVRLGTPFHEVKRMLESEARLAPHSEKRKKQVPSIIASLRRMGLVG